jgi:hypothetical protein
MAKLESQQALGPSQGAVANAQSQGAATPSGVINQNSVASISASQNSTAKVAGGQKPAILNLPPPKMSDLASADNGIAPPVKPGAVEPSSPPAEVAKAYEQPEGRKGFGSYTPNLGYKVADTEYGDINISIYTYVR